MLYNWATSYDLGVEASVLPLQKCHIGSYRRIPGRRWRGILQVQPVGKRQQRYLRPNQYGHKNGSDT